MVYFLFVILFVIFFTCKDNVLFCLINFIFDDLQGFFRRKSYLSDKIRDFIDEIGGLICCNRKNCLYLQNLIIYDNIIVTLMQIQY